MFGFLVFYNIYFNLGEECRNRVLGNIFDIANVSISDVIVENNRVIIRLFSDGVFYQYIFMSEGENNKLLCINRVVDRVTFICNDKFEVTDGFIFQLFHCQDEYQIYQLMKNFL